MISLSTLATVVALAAPPAVDLELDAHGHPRAAGVRATASALGHFELSGAMARAFGGDWAYAGEGRAFLDAGSLRLGLEAALGTEVQGRAFAELPAGPTVVRLTLGYQHQGGALQANGLDGAVGPALLGSLRLESSLGPVVAYARARAFRPLPSAAAVEPDPAEPPADPECAPAAEPWTDPDDVLGINSAINGALRDFQVYPAAGARWKLSRGVALYGELEWAPAGLLISAGVSLSLERLLTLPVPVAVPAAPPVPEVPAPRRPRIEVHLTAAGAPIQGQVVLTGPRRLAIPVGADGVARAELEAGRWRAALHSPGHLSREVAFTAEPDVPVHAEADLRPVPAVRTVMLMDREIRLLQPVQFLPGTSRLAPESAAVLDEVADVMVHEPDRSVAVVAHTDPVPGGSARDRTQGEADAVVDYLRQRVAPERLEGRGAGDREPLYPNLFAEARGRNRRVVFELR